MTLPAWSTASALVWLCVVASAIFLLPVRYDIKVEVLVVVGLCLRLLQSILGPMRRVYGDWNVQYAAMAAYYLPSVVAFNAANTLSSSDSESNLYYVMWCLFLLMFSAYGRAEMRIYTLTAGADQHWVLLKWMVYLSWLQVGLMWTDQKLTLSTFYCFLASLLWFLGILTAKPRVSTLDSNSKAFAEYMKREHRNIITITREANRMSMHGRKYPIVLGYDEQTMLTIGHIPPRSSVVTTDDEDSMLAYSYSQLLARRFFGFHCAEENDPNVLDFAVAQLQQRRAFKIVEVQLAFLHDYFFAAYGHAVMSSCTCSVCGKEGIMVNLVEIIPALKVVLAPTGIMVWAYLLFIVGGTFGVYKAAFHAVASLLLGLLQWFNVKPVVPVYWYSIPTAFWIDCVSAHKFVRWCLSPHYRSRAQPYWQEKIGQYSLMEDYERSCCTNTIIALFKEHVLGEVSHLFTEHYPVEEDPISLPQSVKESVARWFLVIQGPPTNGKTSLSRNGVLDDFGSTLKEEAPTHTILIWQIATWYCSKFLPVGTSNSHAKVAEALSKYCAYLVAFLPQLLPDHSLDTKMVLQQVIEMAKDILGPTRQTMDQKHDKIRRLLLGEEETTSIDVPSDEDEHSPLQPENLQEEQHGTNAQGSQLQQPPPDEDESSLNIFEEGINLGQHLVERDSFIVSNGANHVAGSWKVMADFWAETILYVAPSENAAAHIEQLARGGEFVTHLWAFLSNAGIFKRAT